MTQGTVPTTLELRSISASYGAAPVLKNLSIVVQGGELVALLGPSGSGKTTVLKVIAGLLRPSEGEILFGDQTFTGVPPEKRGAAMVFQKSLLFPHLTVGENVAFGLKMRKAPREEITRRVTEALRWVQLEGYESRRPRELSGGQEQRIALARALVTEPRVLLLDEPFSALDVNLRAEMRALVRSLQRQLHITTIFVTHDQNEASTIADKIALILDGQLEQTGPARDFYTHPRTPEAARFFGWVLIEMKKGNESILLLRGVLPVQESSAFASGSNVMLAFHPLQARVVPLQACGGGDGHVTLKGKLQSMTDLGNRIRLAVSLSAGCFMELEQEAHECLPGNLIEGACIEVKVPINAVRYFAMRSGA